ncbi:unnamed protein product [Paramecium pentaurelia]|uniref:Anaphase-promoting complex subunit 4-like WD40 domain-containing protein n=1 Tax=Paramecium pentaurelia TaxID=43138 RepID=A0A8S1UEN6_9CILI|nr:unnamed protein product [Paramecium pentaurelia]
MNNGSSIINIEQPINQYNNPIITKVNQKLLIKNDNFEQQFYFDYFKQKVAFITYDGFIKIYDIIQTKDGQKHVYNCEIKAHQGAINSLSWQSPKMDNMIATCGEDQTIQIHKETGKVWRQVHTIKENQNPKIVKWIENELILVVGYYEGYFEIRQGEDYKCVHKFEMFNQLIDFDLQLMKQDAILFCCGRNSNSQFIFQIETIKFNDQQKIVNKNKHSALLQSSIYNLKIAPYMNNNEIKVAGQYQDKAVIITIEYNEELDKNIEKFTDQFIQIDSDSWQFEWSTFGNELQIYTQQGVKVYQQNIDDQFMIL